MDHSVFKLGSDAKIDCYSIGNEGEPLVKVESFMAGVEILKQYAVACNKFSQADNYYPGIRMPVPLIYSAALAKNLRAYIENQFGFDPRNAKKAVSTFSIVTCPPDELSLLQRIPHFDAASKKSLAAVHYLADDATSGTAFFRHRKLGYEYVDADRYDTYMQCVKAQFKDKMPDGYIRGSTDEYEMITAFTAKCNRLLLYRGSSLHSGLIPETYAFDPSPATGRLTITSFFEYK
ncbi:MAG TPA: DUF6445 family protein [Gammaproteobacteria bacterium]|jgi:hypothetical protein